MLEEGQECEFSQRRNRADGFEVCGVGVNKIEIWLFAVRCMRCRLLDLFPLLLPACWILHGCKCVFSLIYVSLNFDPCNGLRNMFVA